MTATTADIRAIQLQMTGRDPVFVQQGGALITAPNGAPSSAADGVSVILSSEQSALVCAYTLLPSDAAVTAWTGRWWGYYAGSAIWAPLRNGGVDSTTHPDGESDSLPCGPLSRLYFEVLTLTSSDPAEGLDVRVGPCTGGV